MSFKREWKMLALIILVFLGCFFIPAGTERFDNAVMEALLLTKWYAREHVLMCLVPAFFIAGAIAVFLSQASVMKYLGARANKVLSYGVASISGTLLAVCSCTVLPLFAGIWKRGAGLGPATAFLYSGPAINVLAIILTARVLGLELGVARAVCAILFSVIIGLIMHLVFRREEMERTRGDIVLPEQDGSRPLWLNAVFFASLIGILVFVNWSRPAGEQGFWHAVWSIKWIIAGVCAAAMALMLAIGFGVRWQLIASAALPVIVLAFIFPGVPVVSFSAGVIGLSVISIASRGEAAGWIESSWGFAKQILPLLLLGVLAAGLLLGRPGHEALIPSEWVSSAVGGNSLRANFFASFAGALMYFATLTEVPILQGLLGSGMGKGPALALLLAGPALSLPSMIVIRSVMGTKRMLTFVALVVVMATVSGVLYGAIFG